MNKVLITGASGFVGAHVVRRLRKSAYEILVPTHKELPLESRGKVESFFVRESPDAVIHLATSALMSGKTADSSTLLATNVEGSLNLMNVALDAGVEAFVTMGSFVEYGPKQEPLKEDMRCEPMELYAVSKLAATLYAQGLAKRKDFPSVTFRLFTPYGPGIQEGRLVRIVIEKIAAGEPLKLSDKDVARDFVFVEDISPLLLEALENAGKNKGEIFNLGTGMRTTIGELVEVVESVTNKKAQVEWGAFPVQSYDSKLWQADMKKTFDAFEWRPDTSLDEGIVKTARGLDI